MKTKINLFLLLLLLCSSGWAQKIDLQGTVNDQNNVPLPGVNITVQGTGSGTQTDFDGHYKLLVEVGQTLEFSFVGFATQEYIVGEEKVVNIILSEESSALDEVIITAFGRRMTRNESTSNVVSVSADDISKTPFADATQSLQGRVSGLTVNASSGVPGTASEVRIRGMNSVTASNDPLYIINGIPVIQGSNGADELFSAIDIFSLISPDDIEEINVLKDASAVAPYGADGANGVILVNTKRGRKGRTRYSLDLSVGFQSPAIHGLRIVDAEQKLDAVSEAVWNSYGSGINGNGTLADRSEIPDWLYENNSRYKVWEDNGRPYTNWQHVAERFNRPMTNISFSASGGGDKSDFYMSLGYNKTEGIGLGTDFKRWSSALYYGVDLNDKTRVTISTNIANAIQNGLLEKGEGAPFSNPFTPRYLGNPWVSLYHEDGSLWTEQSLYDYTGVFHNQYFLEKNDIRRNDVTRAISVADLEYELAENLTFKTVFGIDYTLQYSKFYANPIMSDDYVLGGSDTENSLRTYHYTTQNSLDYNFKWKEKNNFRVTFLQEFNKYKNMEIEGYGDNMANEFLTNLSGASANFHATSTFADRMNMRYVGMLNYNFDKKYLLDASYAYQGDSRFSDHYDGFYAVGLGWNLHEEDFLINRSNIDVLRFKVGYGLTGNAGIGVNEYQALATFNQYDNNPAAVISGYGSNASWEKSKRLDFSMDFGFFNNRLSGALGYFINKTYDMLFDIPLPRTAGFIPGSTIQNAGEMRNSGVEFAVSADLIKTADFSWNVSGNISTLKNKITSMDTDAEITTDRQVVHEGHQAYEWYMPEWFGVDPDNGLPLWYIDRSKNDDLTSELGEAKRQYTGKSPLPKYHGSILTRLDYKKFYLEAQLLFSGGNYKLIDRSDGLYRTRLSGNSSGTSVIAYKGAWREPGDQSEFPRFDMTDTRITNAAEISTHFLRPLDYMRFREIAVGYTIDKGGIKESLGFDRLTLSVRGTNLFTFMRDDMYKFDPENVTDIRGRFNFTVPPAKSVTFNLNVTF